MPIFISYSRQDSHFVDQLAGNLVKNRHNVWLDRWELNIGDSLIDRIQGALTKSSAILVILSKNSIESEWCKKELSSSLIRELEEKQVLVLPCVIDDCAIPLFLRDKLYADFRHDPDSAFLQLENSLLRITNRQQGRFEDAESPNFHTDWSYDWKQGPKTGLWYFEWAFVDHGADIEYVILTQCRIACNDVSSARFDGFNKDDKQGYIIDVFSGVVDVTTKGRLKIVLSDAFEKFEQLQLCSDDGELWLVEISSRRMGRDNGKNTLVHIDQIFERALQAMKPDSRD